MRIKPENRDWFIRGARGVAGSAASLGRETNASNCAHDFRGQGWPHSRRKASRSHSPKAALPCERPCFDRSADGFSARQRAIENRESKIENS